MIRKLVPAVAALTLVLGCAGPSKLAQKSEEQLAGGEHWRAWHLATKALDKEPGNMRARRAAAAAASAISQEYQDRVHALAVSDSVAAAEQVLEFADFRAAAVRYAVVPVGVDWPGQEQALRRAAARVHYAEGRAALQSDRPKKAYLAFEGAERFIPGYRDAGRLADQAYDQGLTQVMVAPFNTASADPSLGRQIADAWRGELGQRLAPAPGRFTRVVDSDASDRLMTVAQLNRLTPDDAVRLCRKAGAERVVWGSLGTVRSETSLHLFTDAVWRREVVKDSDGHEATRWVEVPIQVIARVRTVEVPVEYQLLSAHGGAPLARRRDERSSSARVVWTSYLPEGDLDAYTLVSDVMRAANPEGAKAVEGRWRATCGDNTTLHQVLEARRTTRGSSRYSRSALPGFIAGAAFVFMEDLPPADDLAFAALSSGWRPLYDELVRLDPVDDADLGVSIAGSDER